MNAEIKIFDDNGYLYSAENVKVTDLEIEYGINDLSTPHETAFMHNGYRSISLSGQIVDFIDRNRKLNRKVLII